MMNVATVHHSSFIVHHSIKHVGKKLNHTRPADRIIVARSGLRPFLWNIRGPGRPGLDEFQRVSPHVQGTDLRGTRHCALRLCPQFLPEKIPPRHRQRTGGDDHAVGRRVDRIIREVYLLNNAKIVSRRLRRLPQILAFHKKNLRSSAKSAGAPLQSSNPTILQSF